MGSMRFAALLLLAVRLAAVEVGPVLIVRPVDGDTVIVRIGDQEERVRLLWIDTPERKANQHGEAMPEGGLAALAMATVLRAGRPVYLWGPAGALERDGFGRLLAVVYQSGNAEDDRATRAESSAQEYLIRAGWTPYWRKYGEAPEPLHARLLAAQAAAERAGVGGWATIPQWMRDKSNERTAPKVGAKAKEE